MHAISFVTAVVLTIARQNIYYSQLWNMRARWFSSEMFGGRFLEEVVGMNTRALIVVLVGVANPDQTRQRNIQ